MDELPPEVRDFLEECDKELAVVDRFEPQVRAMMLEFPTVEEYAARYGRRIIMCSYGHGAYSDPKVGEWIRRLLEIIRNRADLKACEERFLTAEELVQHRKPMVCDWSIESPDPEEPRDSF